MVDAFELAQHLEAHGQVHLLDGIDALTGQQRSVYLDRLASIDWADVSHVAGSINPQQATASRVVTLSDREQRRDELRSAGEQAYADGAVAVLMVAGGQGTRLGLSGPKGCFEIGAHSGKSIYQIQSEKVLSLSRRIGHSVPFLVMTSPATDAETRAFFAVHDRFGLEEGQLRFFCQGTVPSLDENGRALLQAPGQLLENPDGHGGCFTALIKAGQLQQLANEHIRHLVYIQVDNVLAPVDDCELIGLAELEQVDVVTKVLPKAHPDEKVGHLVSIDGRDHIVEYTEVTPEQARQVGSDGAVIYRWGSPALHCWSVGFLKDLHGKGFVPPLHRSRKPLQAYSDGQVQGVDGYKCERFIFDLLPQAAVSLGLEIDRAQEFAPVKNAEGDDSPMTARQIASSAWKDWLQLVGVDVQADAVLEVSPLFAATATQFAQVWDGRLSSVTGDFYLEDDAVIDS